MDEINNIVDRMTSGANELLVINTIRRRGTISRVDIAKTTGMTAPTVTNITGKLMQAGVIQEHMIGEYSGGRRPILLKINPDIAKMIIVNIRSKEMLGYLINAGLEIKKEICHDIQGLNIDEVLSLMLETITELRSYEDGNSAAGIGIIVRGPVKSKEGISLFSPRIGWRNVPLKYIVEDQFHLPTFVENDMRAMALGVYHYGQYGDIKSLIFLGVGGGIGSGIILNGELYRGVNDSAGEIGHSVVESKGPLCSCGNGGCLEALASETALISNVVNALREGKASLVSEMVQGELAAVRPEHIYTAAVQGDGVAIDILQQAAYYLGLGAANLINVFNPELLIVGGGIVKGRHFIENIMNQVIKERSLESCYSSVRVEFSTEGREAALKGIVDLVLGSIL
jgi:predicted NBD/HSP70 family sugar kinase